MRIVIIGSGNTATVLGRKFLQMGHPVVQVCGRNRAAVEELAGILKTGFTTDINKISGDADLYVIAVADDAIAEVAGQLSLDKKLVVHTAGSVSINVLGGCSRNYGVLYPLQSLRKQMQVIPEIPFLVDGNHADDKALIAEFALSLGSMAMVANDEKRMKIHLAAVMVSNFTNHLYTLAHTYCQQEKVDFQLLHPLIIAIAERLRVFPPSAVQTGPAVRHDTKTINKHLELLKEHPEMKEFYSLFTQSIEKMYP